MIFNKDRKEGELITSKSQGNVTCDSLRDVTCSHGTHDVRDLSGRSKGSRMRKQHLEGQNCIVMSGYVYEGVLFLLPLFRINRNRSSSTQARCPKTLMRVREGGRWC